MARNKKVKDCYLKDLPDKVQKEVMNINKIISKAIHELVEDNKNYADLKNSNWAMSCIDEFCTPPNAKTSVRVFKSGKNYECMIQATGHFENHQYGWIEELLHECIQHTYQNSKGKIRKDYDYRLDNECNDGENYEGFDMYPPKKTAEMIWNLLEDRKARNYKESEEYDITDDMMFTEATSDKEIDADTINKARRLSLALCKSLMNQRNSVTQYQANIFSNILSDAFIKEWAPGYNHISIKVDDKLKPGQFEFKIPKLTEDFIGRFLTGRETLSGFLHRDPTIKIRMHPKIFKTMKSPEDGYRFFKAATEYYVNRVEGYCEKITLELMKLNRSIKELMINSKLSSLARYPIMILFQFDNVVMSDTKTFILSNTDINAVNKFIKEIQINYNNPGKEAKKIVNDLKATIRELHEHCELDYNLAALDTLCESIEAYYNHQFDNLIDQYNEKFYNEQVDHQGIRDSSYDIKVITEKFGVKKLKKIPADLVAYIQIETEAIQDANDKMMIASYCISKLEIVEWYIELLEVGSKKYIVPHTKPQLELIRTQLLACYKNIMNTKITRPSDRPIIDIKYPKGYEG